MMRSGTVLTLTLGLALVAVSGAAAQNRVQIAGTVLDNQTGDPIPSVNLVVRNAYDQFLGSTVSDSAGRFTFTVYRTRAILIYAARFGYTRTTTPRLYVDGSDFFEVRVHMDPDALVLAPLEVVARSTTGGSPVLANFRHRLMSGTGHYITRADIERRRPMYVTDMLQDVPGVRLSSSGRGSRRVVHMSRSDALPCSVQLYVDGRFINRGLAGLFEQFSIDDYVEPEAVEGIEIYRGLSTIPPEFLTPEAKCGVIAVWTRRGDTY
jgi:outer membrane receptor protein involved in Fe transport